jgi:predicted RNase H-like HicB family nuclease
MQEEAMLTDYIQAALNRATYELLPDGEGYYGDIPGLDGIYGNAATLEACRADLQSALEGWIVLGLKLGHTLPVLDGIDLNEPATAEVV